MSDLTLGEIEGALEKKLDQKLNPIKKSLDGHDNLFKSIVQRLDSLTLDMVDVQKKTDILPDLYSLIKGTKEKVDEHEERLRQLEPAA